MHILRVCKRNGYCVPDLDYFSNCLIMSIFTFCIRVWVVAAYTKYPSQIDRLLRRPFDLGIFNMKHRFNRLLKTGM